MNPIEKIKSKIIKNLIPISDINIKYCNGDIMGSYNVDKMESCDITSNERRKSIIDKIFNSDFNKSNLVIIESSCRGNSIRRIEIKRENNGEYICI